MINKENLDNNKTDLFVSISKSVLGITPAAGPFLSELVGNIVPNQRIDRLSKYVKILNKRIDSIESEKLECIKNDEHFIDLIEEGFYQASRALSNERRVYIVSIIINGINDEKIEFQESKLLMKILEELNDLEIIWLRYYIDPIMNSDSAFRDTHKKILAPIPAYIGSDKETLQKSALQNSYKTHLERLGLISGRIRIDKTTKVPEFNLHSGKPKISVTETTRLGKMLLEQIGLIEEI